jgi:hypothetical protein
MKKLDKGAFGKVVLARMKLMGGQSSSEEFSLWSLFHMYA